MSDYNGDGHLEILHGDRIYVWQKVVNLYAHSYKYICRVPKGTKKNRASSQKSRQKLGLIFMAAGPSSVKAEFGVVVNPCMYP